jgi:hypothetical protein
MNTEIATLLKLFDEVRPFYETLQLAYFPDIFGRVHIEAMLFWAKFSFLTILI